MELEPQLTKEATELSPHTVGNCGQKFPHFKSCYIYSGDYIWLWMSLVTKVFRCWWPTDGCNPKRRRRNIFFQTVNPCLDSIAVSLFGWSGELQNMSSPNKGSIRQQDNKFLCYWDDEHLAWLSPPDRTGQMVLHLPMPIHLPTYIFSLSVSVHCAAHQDLSRASEAIPIS